MLYSEKVMDHFQHPRNVGKMDDADGIGEVGNAVCGDIMKMYIKVRDGIIVDVKFNTFGCGSAIATSSMATEMIKGKSIDEALALSNKAVVEALDGLPAHKIHCSVLAEEAVKAAVKDYYDKHGIAYDPEQFCSGDCACCHAHDVPADAEQKCRSPRQGGRSHGARGGITTERSRKNEAPPCFFFSFRFLPLRAVPSRVSPCLFVRFGV